MNVNALGFQERIVHRLKTLFETYGYTQYKMNKFEEYDLYSRNRDFLLSDNVITFTDLGGKLMALKPDVTLSIVKNCRDDVQAQQKLYYREHVYRVDSGGHSFREMMQLGLEVIGCVDGLCILEVLHLAAGSLKEISGECVLDVSHLGILSDVLTSAGIPEDQQKKAIQLIGEKNLHELSGYCRSCGLPEASISALMKLLSTVGSPQMVLPIIRSHLSDTKTLDGLVTVFEAMEGSGLEDIFRFDFSAVGDTRYYNGVVFKGYIRGLPSSVLSGGQYDNLMRKMNRKSDAIGFAVYVDRLEQLEPRNRAYDVDAVVLYDETTSLESVMAYTEELRAKNLSVMTQRQRPETVLCRQLIRLRNGEVEILENNA